MFTAHCTDHLYFVKHILLLARCQKGANRKLKSDTLWMLD